MRYKKDCIKQYNEGWFITMKPLCASRKKLHGPYKSKNIALNDLEVLNDKDYKPIELK